MEMYFFLLEYLLLNCFVFNFIILTAFFGIDINRTHKTQDIIHIYTHFLHLPTECSAKICSSLKPHRLQSESAPKLFTFIGAKVSL